MEKTNQSFLDIIIDYFSELKSNEVFGDDKTKVVIPREWIFPNKNAKSQNGEAAMSKRSTDSEVIEKALINIICKANKDYRSRMEKDKPFYSQIHSIEIEGSNLIINARDGWTKIVVTRDKDLRGPFYAIDEERLYSEVQRVSDFRRIGDICKTLDASMAEREKLIEDLKINGSKPEWKQEVEGTMALTAHKLVNYYKYMIVKKREHETLSGIIRQRRDTGKVQRKSGSITSERVSEVYDFNERSSILEEMNPTAIVTIDQIDDDSTVSRLAYTTFIYENPRGKEGYLFVAEPFEGTHSTRMRFVPQGEYDKAQVKSNKLIHFTEDFLEMSDNEFETSRYTRKFNHTSIEKLRQKYRRIILGERTPNGSDERRYKEIDDILFEGERKIGKAHFEKILARIRTSDVNVGRGMISDTRPNEQVVQ